MRKRQRIESKAARMARENREAASRTPAYRDGYADYVARLDEGGSFSQHAPRYEGARHCAALQSDYTAGWMAADRRLGRF